MRYTGLGIITFTMKRFILLFVLIANLFIPSTVAKADETRYSRILTEDVMLYIDSSLAVEWFTLPLGYYVKVLSVTPTAVKVEYKSDNPSRPSAKGYVSPEHLNVVTQTPPVLFPNLVLTVNQNCMLFKDTDFSISETVTQNSTVDYYGILETPNGEKYIYGYVNTASGDKYVGYLPLSAVYDFSPPSLPIESNTESSAEQDSVQNSNEVSNGLGNSLQLVIIIAVSVVAISIVYLLFKPSPSKAKDEVLSTADWDEE